MRSTQTKKAICLRKARFLPCLPFIYRFFSLPNRAENLRYQNWTNKNSYRSSAKLSAWWAHFVLCFVDMLTEGTVFPVPSFYIYLF